MGRPIKNLIGQKFGYLVVQELHHQDEKSKATYWLCKCVCGEETIVQRSNLRSGSTKSCGNHNTNDHFKTHGMWNTPEYNSWRCMKARCLNPNHNSYPDYGGRGIKICERWLNSFENFYEDMGCHPGPDYTLERLENYGDYEPDNCIWADWDQQANNRSNNRRLYYNGENLTMMQWSRKLGIPRTTIYNRLRAGKTIEEAFTQELYTR